MHSSTFGNGGSGGLGGSQTCLQQRDGVPKTFWKGGGRESDMHATKGWGAKNVLERSGIEGAEGDAHREQGA
jgi:hypothetical protein